MFEVFGGGKWTGSTTKYFFSAMKKSPYVSAMVSHAEARARAPKRIYTYADTHTQLPRLSFSRALVCQASLSEPIWMRLLEKITQRRLKNGGKET